MIQFVPAHLEKVRAKTGDLAGTASLWIDGTGRPDERRPARRY